MEATPTTEYIVQEVLNDEQETGEESEEKESTDEVLPEAVIIEWIIKHTKTDQQ